MTKTPFDVYSKRPAPDCGIGPTWPAFLTAKRAVLFALLLGSSALGGCATYIPPEISYDTEVPPLPALHPSGSRLSAASREGRKTLNL